MSFGLDSRRMVSIARQPILDPKARVFGYQLLHDCGPSPGEIVDSAAAVAAGFPLLQGHYFCRPATFVGTQITARRLAYIRLLSALNRENVTLTEVEELVSHDLSLSFRVLRAVNSAAFGLQHEVTS